MNEIEKAIDYFKMQKELFPHSYNIESGYFDVALTALRSQLDREQNEPCEWQQEDEECSDYSASCGYEFVFNEDGPNSNDFIYCPNCGKPIKEIQWQLDE